MVASALKQEQLAELQERLSTHNTEHATLAQVCQQASCSRLLPCTCVALARRSGPPWLVNAAHFWQGRRSYKGPLLLLLAFLALSLSTVLVGLYLRHAFEHATQEGRRGECSVAAK